MKPAAQLFFTYPAQPFAPKSIFKLFSLVPMPYWLVRDVALSLWVALPVIWLYLLPLRDLKGSDRSIASLQPSKRAEEELWLLAKQIQSCQVIFFFLLLFLNFPFLPRCGESSLKSDLGFNGKPSLQLVDIDNCYHLAGCCCLEWSKFGGLNPVITKAGVSELVPLHVIWIES